MTGPEHYLKAEEWLASAEQWFERGEEYNGSALVATAAATIGRGHAMLAEAAATALQMRGADAAAWEAAAGPRREQPMPTALDIVDGRRG